MITPLIFPLFLVIFYVYFRYKRRNLYALSENIPSPGSLPLIGHAHWFIGGPEKIFNNLLSLCKQLENVGGVAKVWIGSSLYITIINPEDAKIVLENCLAKDFSYKYLQAWLGNGLFVAPVSLWRKHRRALLPMFQKNVVDDYIEVFGEQAAVLVERLEEKDNKDKFDVYKYVTSCMLDIVFETAMGEKMDVQHNPDTPYLKARSTVMTIINMRFFKVWLQPDLLFKLTPYFTQQKKNIEATHKFTDQVVKTKRNMYEKDEFKNKEHRDILEMLLRSSAQFTDEQLREHIDSITIAGNDTTALVISYALVLLGCHQQCQQIAYQEQKNIFGEEKRAPNKNDLLQMDYLERVIKETMRLYAVVPIIARRVDKDLKLSNYTVPAGAGCVIAPFVMHRSRKIWGPDADDFDPDRFLPNSSRHPCSFLPFSYGSRDCIGRRFGMLAMKSVLSTIIRNYTITSEGLSNFKIEILLFPVDGHLIKIKKRI